MTSHSIQLVHYSTCVCCLYTTEIMLCKIAWRKQGLRRRSHIIVAWAGCDPGVSGATQIAFTKEKSKLSSKFLGSVAVRVSYWSWSGNHSSKKTSNYCTHAHKMSTHAHKMSTVPLYRCTKTMMMARYEPVCTVLGVDHHNEETQPMPDFEENRER